MNKIRTCSKCGRRRVCRAHSDGCIKKLQPLCLQCNREQFKAWYDLNREAKLLYDKKYQRGYRARQQKLDDEAWLMTTKLIYEEMAKEDRLKNLFK